MNRHYELAILALQMVIPNFMTRYTDDQLICAVREEDKEYMNTWLMDNIGKHLACLTDVSSRNKVALILVIYRRLLKSDMFGGGRPNSSIDE